jgi:hypothetical protein
MRSALSGVLAAVALVAAVRPALAADASAPAVAGFDHAAHMRAMAAADVPAAAAPTLPGQDAFGAIQEIVRILEADPHTDWSQVDLERLRRHLVDMNEVTLNARVAQRPVDGGFEATVTGDGRTLAAIQRMVPAHLGHIEATHLNGWRARWRNVPDGVVVVVTAEDAPEVRHLRGLGFIGVMVSGAHHGQHHLAMAQGRAPH